MNQSNPTGLDQQTQAALIELASYKCALEGHTKIAVFGAGQHTKKHGLAPFRSGGLEVVAILDDHAQGRIDEVEIRSPSANSHDYDAVIVSSDGQEAELLTLATAWAEERGCAVFSIYQVLYTNTAVQINFDTHKTELNKLRDVFTGKLNLGCGEEPLLGWTNIDGGDGLWYSAPKADGIVRLDIFDALAHIDNSSCEAIFSEHFFEHFSLTDGHRLISEWARVLRPGGVVRIVMPNLELESKLYLRQFSPAQDEVIDAHRLRWLSNRYAMKPNEKLTRAMVLNFGMRLDGHQFLYDFETIRQSLLLGGFGEITQARFGQSNHEVFDGIDRHDGGETGRSWVPEMVLAVDAVRNHS